MKIVNSFSVSCRVDRSLWALLGAFVFLGAPALLDAQELPSADPQPTSTTPVEDPFAARQRAWDRVRNPSYPVAGPEIKPGPNLDFTPPPSCDSSCSIAASQCFAVCPGGRAIDRLNATSSGRDPGLSRCQAACSDSLSSCTVECTKGRPRLSLVLPPVIPASPATQSPPSVPANNALVPEPLVPGPPDINPKGALPAASTQSR